jgi:hypothetical protein
MPTKATRTALFFTVNLLFVRVWRPIAAGVEAGS